MFITGAHCYRKGGVIPFFSEEEIHLCTEDSHRVCCLRGRGVAGIGASSVHFSVLVWQLKWLNTSPQTILRMLVASEKQLVAFQKYFCYMYKFCLLQ